MTIPRLAHHYATISSDGEHIVTTSLLDREREAHINLLLVCNITILKNESANSHNNGKAPMIISTDIHSTNNGSPHSVQPFLSQFRKQVKIQVVDR